MGPLIYLNSTELKTIQLGIRMFISQYAADYALIMAASVCALIPVVIIFIACQKFFVEGVGGKRYQRLIFVRLGKWEDKYGTDI